MLSNIEEGLYKTFTLDHLTEVEALIKDLEFHRKTNNPLKLLSRIQLNVVKKLGIPFRLVYGLWNGYGYPTLGRSIDLSQDVTVQEIIKLLKKLNKFYSSKAKPKRKILSHEDKIMAWAKRLAKLINSTSDSNTDRLTIEEAIEIAEEKLQYEIDKIEELVERQYLHFSSQRQKLINKLSRKNPLRRIEDVMHAKRIMNAHYRHTATDYDSLLKEGRELAQFGEIEYDEIKDYAYSKIV